MRLFSLDFETTGLDPKHDEPIQVAVISYDLKTRTGSIFSSYIKPRGLSTLSDVVTHITGISLADLSTAPMIEDIEANIADVIGEGGICLGHNISFDLAIASYHMKTPLVCTPLDTREISQVFLPYRDSYALDELTRFLLSDEVYCDISRHLHAVYGRKTRGESHDALTDVIDSMTLFLWCRAQTKILFRDYGKYLSPLYHKTNSFVPLVADDWVDESTTVIAFPSLSVPQSVSLSRPTARDGTTELAAKFFRPGSAEDFFHSLIAAPYDSIVAFSHTQKLTVAKNILHDLGYNDIGYLHANQVFDPERWLLFLDRESLGRAERSFCLLYFVHLRQGLRVLHCSRPSEKMILSFLIKQSTAESKHITLCTHQSLYHHADELLTNTIHPPHLRYMDGDRWHNTYNKFQSTTIDPYYLLELFDNISYQSEYLYPAYRDRWKNIIGQYMVWMGIFFMDARLLCREYSVDNYDIHGLESESVFFWTIASLRSLDRELSSFFALFDQSLIGRLSSQRKSLLSCLSRDVRVVSQLGHQGSGRFILQCVSKYVDFHELDALWNVPVHYGSLTKPHPTWGGKDFVSDALPSWSVKYCSHRNNGLPAGGVFVLSIDKKVSTRLRKEAKNATQGFVWSVEAENISSGHKKLVSRAQHSDVLIIGGYALYLSILASGARPQVYIGYVTGPLAPTVRADMARYGQGAKS